jgi:hypothetical protein
MTDICAAGAANPNHAGARKATRKERGIELRDMAVVMSREIFESLPTVPCDDIEPRGASFHKTQMGSQWYVVDQEGSRKPIEIGIYVSED